MAFCDKFRARVKKALKGFDAFIDKYTGIALAVTTNIKKAINSPVADVLAAIIPGTVDDKILAKARQALEISVDALGIYAECDKRETLEEKIQCLINAIRLLPKDAQNAVLIKLAARMTAEMDDNRYAQHMYDLYTQGAYSSSKEEADENPSA